MIKGINKQVLEVTNPQSPYFEKIVFFVKPASSQVEEKTLKEEAQRITEKMKKPPREKKSFKQIAAGGLYVLLGAGAGCALSFLITSII
ncbi:MAG: hypothetical protein E7570_05210 [Ruminococcaceae bacterium]|nr:hypothetical protein [Oscillospiraceae bacterium]